MSVRRLPHQPGHQLRAVIYTRVSADRAGGASVERQEKRGRGVVAAEEWELIDVFSDNGRSASEYAKRERPDWQRLMIDLEAGRFDVLVVWEPSRATRDRMVYAALMATCEEKGVLICIDGRTLDPGKADEALLLDVFFALARHGSAKTQERTDQAVANRAKDGKPAPGRAPFGFRRVYDSATGKVRTQEPDDDVRRAVAEDGTVTEWSPAGLVRDLFADALAGITPYAMANKLNALGIPNPSTVYALEHHAERERSYSARWCDSMIAVLLQNVAYIGQRVHHGTVVADDCWPAIIEDDEKFYGVANAFAARRIGPDTRPARVRHLMSRIVICDECNTPMQSAPGGRAEYAYRCRFGRSYIPEAVLDRFVVNRLLAWLTVPANIAKLRRHNVAENGTAATIAEARGTCERLEAELRTWKRNATKGLIDQEDYIARRAVLLPEITDARRRATMTGIPPVLHDLIDVEDMVATWEDLMLPAQRLIVTTLIDVRVLRAGRGRRNMPTRERVIVTPRIT